METGGREAARRIVGSDTLIFWSIAYWAFMSVGHPNPATPPRYVRRQRTGTYSFSGWNRDIMDLHEELRADSSHHT